MEASEAQIRFDPTTNQIVEYVPQQVSAEDFETRLNDATNRLNSDRAELVNAEEAHREALKAVDVAWNDVEAKRAAVDKGEIEVAFQGRRKEQYDAAVAASQAAPAPDTEAVASSSVEEVAVPTRVADQFPV